MLRFVFFVTLVFFYWIQSPSFQERTQELTQKKALLNPASQTDSIWGLRTLVPRSEKTPSFPLGSVISVSPLSRWFKHQIWLKTSQTQWLSATQLALWFGDLRGLPFWLIDKYRSSGLLAVLAISGQHVWALVFALSFLGLKLGQFLKKNQGFYLIKLRRLQFPLAAGFLLVLAVDEPSILRTFLCVIALWKLKQIPIKFNLSYLLVFLFMLVLILCPELGHSKSFVLSAAGVLGIVLSQQLFSEMNLGFQVFFVSIWAWLWLAPVVLFYFGQWAGHQLVFQFLMGWIWDQIFLPFFFLLGMALLLMSQSLSFVAAENLEKLLLVWANWEAVRAEVRALFIYRPRPWEVVLFWLWLLALGVLFRNTRWIDLMRRARRE